MKRYLGLDLGTKTLGVSITDKSNTIIFPYTLIRFKHEDYETAFNEVKEIVEKEDITDIIIGLPKNMDGSLGFAADRTFNFCKLLERLNKNVVMVDERLTSIEAQKILLAKDKPFKSYLLPLISAIKVKQGYTKDYVRNMGLYEFFDDVERAQVINNADHLLSGAYSGMMDLKKVNKQEFNWMREL